MEALREGAEAPDFTVLLDNGETFTLSALRGRKNVVLYFYPRDFSPGCTREACTFRDEMEEFRSLSAEVVGVSLDSLESHARFRERHSLPYPLVVDDDRQISRAYGVLRLGGLLPLRRVTFIIDKQGIIRRVIHDELRMGRHISAALAALEELQEGGEPPAPTPSSSDGG